MGFGSTAGAALGGAGVFAGALGSGGGLVATTSLAPFGTLSFFAGSSFTIFLGFSLEIAVLAKAARAAASSTALLWLFTGIRAFARRSTTSLLDRPSSLANSYTRTLLTRTTPRSPAQHLSPWPSPVLSSNPIPQGSHDPLGKPIVQERNGLSRLIPEHDVGRVP